MRTHHIARRSLLVPALGLALAATMTACSSSSSSSSSSVAASASATTSSAASASTSPSASASPSAAASSPSASTGSAATIAAIKKNWVTFFNPKTPVATKVTLVQDGQKFEAFLKASASNPSAATSSATVQSVTLTSPTQAAVVYTILVSGTPMLANQKGIAVYQNGTWKVGLTSFCALAALENSGKAVPGCPSAG